MGYSSWCADRRRCLGWALALAAGPALGQAQRVQTPYRAPKVLFDIYLDHPDKIGAALYWVRSFFQPLLEAPYRLFPEDVRAIVLMHGTEIVTLARHHEARYAEAVQRMRYYAEQGVEFRVCGLALQDYGYRPEDLQPFVRIAPSAITELVHWQNEGYALVVPQVTDKRVSIEMIR
ncbi:MAG: DsrE family protein [Tepidimonas sp.]|uniref:DsrE family protein n=1 Tax=Tepidimonas sp. TaxID=2002775 RepID=UPI00298EE7AA|nr:DsrE family protein [Tepidimonas sp.]MDW8336364.1 DsrE family protein [Tepidimonas sp.]